MADDQEETAKQQRVFGPMAPKAAPAPEIDYDKLAKALVKAQGGGVPEAPVPEDVPEEDKAVLAELARVHPTARGAVVRGRHQVAGNLYMVEVSYQLTTGSHRIDSAFLVHDDGEKIYVFRAD